jgi:hypothetical protein
MSPELAQAALTFLMRADLKGGEADAFMQVCAAIRQLGMQAAQARSEPAEKS